MKLLIPIALLITIVLLYLQFKNFTEVLIVPLGAVRARGQRLGAVAPRLQPVDGGLGPASSRSWGSRRKPAS